MKKLLLLCLCFSYFLHGSQFNEENFLYKGTIYNNLLCHREAIIFLNQAIEENPSNILAYTERATAYFELGELDLAINDYKYIKHLQITPPYKPNHSEKRNTGFFYERNHRGCELSYESLYGSEFFYDREKDPTQNSTLDSKILREHIEFSEGLIAGIRKGASQTCEEFIPTVFGSLRGLLHGLWAFVCHPLEVSEKMKDSTYAMGQFIASWGLDDYVGLLVPEIQECAVNWNNWTEHTKGSKMGYIIGKYGIDIFMPYAGASAVKKFRALKRANTLTTLENCLTPSKKQIIIIQSEKHAQSRKVLIQYAKDGRVIPQNANVMSHVMQKKHAWNQVVPMTGNMHTDFKSVLELLAKSKILDKSCFENVTKYNEIFTYQYEKNINGNLVRALFDKDKESSILLLKNAYVVTK